MNERNVFSLHNKGKGSGMNELPWLIDACPIFTFTPTAFNRFPLSRATDRNSLLSLLRCYFNILISNI